jgi:hypothetical protein
VAVDAVVAREPARICSHAFTIVARQLVEHHGGTLTTAREGLDPTLTVSLSLA